MNNYIKVTNYGDFTIRFSVIYYVSGKRYAKRTTGILRYVTKRIPIPPNADNVQVNVEIARAESSWFKFYSITIPKSQNKCFQVAGYDYKPKCAEISC